MWRQKTISRTYILCGLQEVFNIVVRICSTASLYFLSAILVSYSSKINYKESKKYAPLCSFQFKCKSAQQCDFQTSLAIQTRQIPSCTFVLLLPPCLLDFWALDIEAYWLPFNWITDLLTCQHALGKVYMHGVFSLKKSNEWSHLQFTERKNWRYQHF